MSYRLVALASLTDRRADSKMFGVDDFVSYVQIQSASALRQLAQHYPYDSETGAVTLRRHGDVINEHLAAAIQARIERCMHRSEMIRTPIQRDHVTSQYGKVNKVITTVPPAESKPIPD